MERMTITLPPQMKSYIDELLGEGAYGTASEFIRDLIRHDQERKAHEKLEALVLEGIRSGESEEWTADDVNKLRESVRKQASKRTS